MNPIRRIAAHLNMSIDSFLDQVENHEAVANRAIYEVRAAMQKARSQYYRVKSDSERMSTRIADLKKERSRWVERAKAIHTSDEAKALACVKRVKKNDEEVASLSKQLERNQGTEAQLRLDLEKIESQIEILKRRRNTLASREATAKAVEAVDAAGGGSFREIDEVFERWEAKVAGKEGMSVVHLSETDELEKEFSEEEEKVELEVLLKEVLQTETK